MRIAIYSHSIAPSIDGVCRRFTAILHELDQQGHNTLLFTLEEDPLDIPKKTEFISLDYMIFPSYPQKKVARPTFSSLMKIIKGLTKFKPNVVHIVSDGISCILTLACLILNIPIVGSFHTDIIDLINNLGGYSFQRYCVIAKEWVDGKIFDSCATTSISFKKKLSDRVICDHVIITSVDTKTFSNDKRNMQLRKEMMFGDENGFLCVYVGRISTEKKLDIIINAVKNLKDNGVAAYIALVGDGPIAKQYAKLHGKQNRLYCKPNFLTHLELAEVYASSDVHVSASEFETLGNTVLEAFACKIPVVVPLTQGFQDTVHHNVDGFLFNPRDSSSASEYLQLLKDNKKLCLSMGEKGFDSVKFRTISNVVQDLISWYQYGIEKRQKRFGVNMIGCAIMLTMEVPVVVFLLFMYDLLVNYILKLFEIKDKTENIDESKKLN
eukprot:gene8282-11211_t